MRFVGRFTSLPRALLTWSAIVLLAVGAWYLLRVPWVYLEAELGLAKGTAKPVVVQPQTDVTSAARPVAANVVYANGLFPQAAPVTKAPIQGQLLGRVIIPELHLTAPLVQGTALGILAHSAGHLANSVLPGQVGTALIAAHDVTYFHHLDELKPGQTIEVVTSQGSFTYRVTGHRVVTVGTDVANTHYPSLVLETCYPLNALTLVNHRYLVSAVLSSSTLHASS